MDKISKSLQRIPYRNRRRIIETSKQVRLGRLEGLDLKKLSGSKGVFRARVGRYRIIFQTRDGKNPIILDVTKRDDRTY